MASSYTTSLRLEKQGNGENSATWGTRANTVFDLIDVAIAGYLAKSVAGNTDVTLTTANSSADEARRAVLNLTGALTGNINVIVPTVNKLYLVRNSTTGAFSITVKTTAGTGLVIPQGAIRWIYCDGTNVVDGQANAGQTEYAATSGGSPNAQTIAPVPAILSLVAGQRHTFIAGFTNALAMTLAVNGLTAKAVQIAGAALSGREIMTGQTYEVMYDGAAYQIISGLASDSRGNPNMLVNPDSAVAQAGTSIAAVADNAYTGDGVRVLSEANGDCDWSRGVSGLGFPTQGVEYFDLLTVVNSNKKFGLFRPVESLDSQSYYTAAAAGPTLVFSAFIGASASLNNIKAAIIYWTGTADAISASPISAWGADGVTPTLAAGWAYANTPATLAVNAGGAGALFYVTGTIAPLSTNVGVLVWNDDKTTTVGHQLGVGQWNLRRGAAPLPFEPVPIATNIQRCQRYFWKSFSSGIAPAQNAGVAGAITTKNPIALGDPSVYVQFPVRMRAVPTIVTFNPSAGNANWRNITAGADVTVSVDPATTIGVAGVLLATSGTVATLGDILAIQLTASARL